MAQTSIDKILVIINISMPDASLLENVSVSFDRSEDKNALDEMFTVPEADTVTQTNDGNVRSNVKGKGFPVAYAELTESLIAAAGLAKEPPAKAHRNEIAADGLIGRWLKEQKEITEQQRGSFPGFPPLHLAAERSAPPSPLMQCLLRDMPPRFPFPYVGVKDLSFPSSNTETSDSDSILSEGEVRAMFRKAARHSRYEDRRKNDVPAGGGVADQPSREETALAFGPQRHWSEYVPVGGGVADQPNREDFTLSAFARRRHCAQYVPVGGELADLPNQEDTAFSAFAPQQHWAEYGQGNFDFANVGRPLYTNPELESQGWSLAYDGRPIRKFTPSLIFELNQKRCQRRQEKLQLMRDNWDELNLLCADARRLREEELGLKKIEKPVIYRVNKTTFIGTPGSETMLLPYLFRDRYPGYVGDIEALEGSYDPKLREVNPPKPLCDRPENDNAYPSPYRGSRRRIR